MPPGTHASKRPLARFTKAASTLLWAALFTVPVLGMKMAYRAVSATTEALPAAPQGGAVTRWGADYFPNVWLTTHEGTRVRFFDDLLKDKVVVINFIFTSCTNACPLETARLANVQRILGDRVGRDVFMYSISIDPQHDTPERLREYAANFGAKPGWLFLTGDSSDITLVRKKLGLLGSEVQENQENKADHNLSLMIGNQRTGRWMKRSPFEHPYYLASQIGSWLHNWQDPDPELTSYATAPEVRPLSVGENLFRTRCAPCHSIAGTDYEMPTQGDRQLGPDLLGVVERRDPAWLVRWLAEPDKMLAERDPIVTPMLAQYRQLAMPNLRLNATEVGALVEFLEHPTR